MTIELPGGLVWALELVGIDWPDSDEDKLDQMAQEWLRFSKALTGLVDELVKQADSVTSANSGTAIDAFQRSWTGAEAPLTNLRDGADAAAEIALALGICAKIVTAYKGVVLAEIAAFAYSVGAAAAASSTGIGAIIGAGIVIARRIIAQQAIDAALNLAVEKLLNG
jgi:hypothetical protein